MKALKSKNILIDGSFVETHLIINDEGIISNICDDLPNNFNGDIEDFGTKHIIPGLVDTHVHINEPGRTQWEGFNTATKAAAAGGITTVIDMPLNCIPATTTKQALQEKINSLENKLWIDVGFWGGAVPNHLDDLEELLNSGVMGVKTFLIDSGVPEFLYMTKDDLEKAMPIIAKSKLPYLIHAEIDDGHKNEVNKVYQSFLNSRPRSWENNAVELMIEMTKKHQTKTHIVHLASADALLPIKKAKDAGITITAETCPHYLTLNSEAIKDGHTEFKCCPPIREDENRLKLWQGIKDGVIDFIVSDHSPCTPQLKLMEEGDLDKAWGGISSLQFSLSLIWTEAKKQGISLAELSRLMSEKTAKFIGLDHLKGKIQVGHQADLVIFAPDEKYKIHPDQIFHRHKVTPYEGKEVFGKVYQTILRGECVYDHKHNFTGPKGHALLRGKNV